MVYTVLDSGNFFVIPGSPVDVWAAECYIKNHKKHQIRTDNGFSNDDLVVLVVGSSFFYDKLAWDYTLVMRTIEPLLITYSRRNDAGVSSKFVFLWENSTDGFHEKLQVGNFLIKAITSQVMLKCHHSMFLYIASQIAGFNYCHLPSNARK